MKLYNKIFCLDKSSINIENVQFVSEEGIIFYIIPEKIEGFFDVCNQRGLTGTQGVIIPQQNVEDLVLKNEVIDAVSKGIFHIYSVKYIHQGIEILTDYPYEKIKELVNKKLKSFEEKEDKNEENED